MNELSHQEIKEVILKSQKCQRNWDLTKKISNEHMDLLIQAATQCPSKQNVAYYKLNVITNRSYIENIHAATLGFTKNNYDQDTELETNSQALANVLFVFEENNYENDLTADSVTRNVQTERLKNNTLTDIDRQILNRDKTLAVGVASGYLALLSNQLGYSTGFCSCFDSNKIEKILNTNEKILLLLGVGFADNERNRLEHHNSGYVYPSTPKQPIKVNIIK
jgi:nitroreductase